MVNKGRSQGFWSVNNSRRPNITSSCLLEEGRGRFLVSCCVAQEGDDGTLLPRGVNALLSTRTTVNTDSFTHFTPGMLLLHAAPPFVIFWNQTYQVAQAEFIKKRTAKRAAKRGGRLIFFFLLLL